MVTEFQSGASAATKPEMHAEQYAMNKAWAAEQMQKGKRVERIE